MLTDPSGRSGRIESSNDPSGFPGERTVSTADEANETTKSGSATHRHSRILQHARLEQVPSPPASVQPPEQAIFAVPGGGKSYAFIETLATSGVFAKTVTDRIARPVMARRGRPQDHVVLHQQWEGYVESVTKHGFEALLVDLTDRSRGEERTEIDLDEVSAFDHPLVQPGAVFYWSMGYRVRPSGQREGLSVIRFRRLPVWTAEELDAAARAARETAELFGWGEPRVQVGDEGRRG